MVSRQRPGRPLKFQSVEELQTMIDLYFQDCDKRTDTREWSHDEIIEDDQGKTVCAACGKRPNTKGCMVVSGELKLPRPYTVTGLAVWLDTSRQTLLRYDCREEFRDTIAAARQRIEAYGEEHLFDPKVPTHGVKFSLSNNHDGWANKSESRLTIPKDGAKELAERVFDDAVGEEHNTGEDAPAPQSHAAKAGTPE